MAWQSIPLGDVISHRSEFIEITPDATYSRCRVQTSARGIVLRDRIEGAAIKTKRQQVCRAGEFLVAEIDAKMGGYGLVPLELDGAIVSSHYFLYQIDKSRLSASYLNWFSKTPQFADQVSAQGSTNYAAIRPDAVLSYLIPLPSLDEQEAIVRRLDAVSTGILESSLLAEEAAKDLHALVFSLHESLSEIQPVRLGSLLELDERHEPVEPEGEYPQLGIRSFGNGLFFKEAVSGADTSYKKFNQVYQGGLIVSQPKGWEGAIAVATSDHDGWFVSPEYRTFRCREAKLDPDYLAALIVTPWFQHSLTKMTKGQGARRERLRPEMLLAFELRMPTISKQKQALKIIEGVQQASKHLSSRTHEVNALVPAMLHEIFEKQPASKAVASASTSAVVALPVRSQSTTVDTPFKEAVLVGAIISAFHEEGGQPLGNFRLQKAVYFARRFMGETALDGEYLRKAAGPYNPTMRYSGGMKVALEKNWIAPATGKYGPGHSPGTAIDDAVSWIEKYSFAQAAAWVRDKFKFKQNDIWELLATIDYAKLALDYQGAIPTARAVFDYIDQDSEWHPKIAKLGLTEPAIQNAMVELTSLFDVVEGSREVPT